MLLNNIDKMTVCSTPTGTLQQQLCGWQWIGQQRKDSRQDVPFAARVPSSRLLPPPLLPARHALPNRRLLRSGCGGVGAENSIKYTLE